MRLQLAFFGSARAVLDDGAGSGRPIPRRLIPLLGYLVANRGRTVSRDTIAEALWPERDPVDARGKLRRQLHLLAAALDPIADACLDVRADAIRWRDDAPADTTDDGYGEYLAGIDGAWLPPLRSRLLAERRTRAIESARRAEASGDVTDALADAARLAAADPWDEDAVRRLIALRAAAGDRAGAIAEFRAFDHRLRTELGAEPAPETYAAYARVVSGARGFSSPTNLPRSAGRFIGREVEIAQAGKMLYERRVLVLTGPGGHGKTRLALRIATIFGERYPDGVWFADGAQATPDVLAQRIAEAGGEPVRSETPLRTLADRLSTGATLVILDGCDDDLDAALSFAETLAGRAPASATIVTTRRPAPGAIASLAVEPLPEGAQMQLFADRAVHASPDFVITPGNAASVSSVLARSGGIPLAIELAAARLNLMTIDGIAKRMQDQMGSFIREGRMQGTAAKTLEAMVRWSYDVLSETERRLFVRFAAFPHDGTLDAIQQICAEEGEDVFIPLSELVESTLVRARTDGDEARYDMLDTTRAFARLLFDASPDRAEIERRHAAYYAELLRSHAPAFRTEAEASALRICRPELSNLRAMVERAIDGAGHAEACGLAEAIGFIWYRAGYPTDAEAHLRRLRDRPEFRELAPATRASLHRALGRIAIETGHYEAGAAEIETALAGYREAGDERGIGEALAGLGVTQYYRGAYEPARRLLDEGIERLRPLGPAFALANAIGNLGALDLAVGALDAGKALLLESAAMWMRLGMPAYSYMQYANLGLLETERGDAEAAVGYARIAVEIATEHAIEPQRRADAHTKLAQALRLARRFDEAWEAHLAALALIGRSGNLHYRAEQVESVALTAAACGDAELAAVALAKSGLMREGVGTAVNPIQREALERARASVAEQLGEVGLARASARAVALDLDGLCAAIRKTAAR